MIQLGKEEHAQATAIANHFKSQLVGIPPRIAFTAIIMLLVEAVVHISGQDKVRSLKTLAATAHDLRDAVRAYFKARDERTANPPPPAAEPHLLSEHRDD